MRLFHRAFAPFALVALVSAAVPSSARAQDVITKESAATLKAAFIADLDNLHTKFLGLANGRLPVGFEPFPVFPSLLEFLGELRQLVGGRCIRLALRPNLLELRPQLFAITANGKKFFQGGGIGLALDLKRSLQLFQALALGIELCLDLVQLRAMPPQAFILKAQLL